MQLQKTKTKQRKKKGFLAVLRVKESDPILNKTDLQLSLEESLRLRHLSSRKNYFVSPAAIKL